MLKCRAFVLSLTFGSALAVSPTKAAGIDRTVAGHESVSTQPLLRGASRTILTTASMPFASA
jgi:hypothetical protein